MTFEEFKLKIQTPYNDENCPIIKTLELLSGKWTTRVIYELERNEKFRFGELKRALPTITNTMLSNTLKLLEEKNIVIRTQFDEIPLKVEYSLSETGKSMLKIYYEIALWGDKFLK